MVGNYISGILKDNTLKPELKRVLKSAFKFNAVMSIKSSEIGVAWIFSISMILIPEIKFI